MTLVGMRIRLRPIVAGRLHSPHPSEGHSPQTTFRDPGDRDGVHAYACQKRLVHQEIISQSVVIRSYPAAEQNGANSRHKLSNTKTQFLGDFKMLTPLPLPGSRVPGIYEHYVANRPEAVQFFGEHYDAPRILAKRAEAVSASFRGDREHLVRMLTTYNRRLGCQLATETNIQKLRCEDGVAVLCGQQAGLLSGPLYTIHKAAAAIKLAARLEAELQRPVAPVFWIASEDHDFPEANHCYVLDKKGDLQRLQLELEHGGEPLGHLKLQDEPAQRVLENLSDLLPESEFAPDIVEQLEKAQQASATPAEWFARVMTHLFSDQGLVFFDPLLPEAREMASGVLHRAIQLRGDIEVTLASREAALVEEGYHLQVERAVDSTLLMIMNGRRSALHYRDGHYVTRDVSVQRTEKELLDLARLQPESLSPNALLRPLVQDTIFPTVAFMLGAGEISYLAQAAPLYPLFGVEPPVFWPRPWVTLLEPRLKRYIRRYKIPEEALLGGLNALLAKEMKRADGLDVDGLFGHLRKELAAQYDELKGTLAQLSPELEKLTEKNLHHVYNQVSYLENRTRAEQKKQNQVMIRHFNALDQALRPTGKLQERILGIHSFLFRYGPDFWNQLMAEFPSQPGHYLFSWD